MRLFCFLGLKRAMLVASFTSLMMTMIGLASAQQPRNANATVVRGQGGSSLWRSQCTATNESGDCGSVPGFSAYLRFYSDGTVISAATPGTPAQIASWFKAPYSTSGHYSISGSSVKFSLKDSSKKTDDTEEYDGFIQGSSIQFHVFSHVLNQRYSPQYELVADAPAPVKSAAGITSSAGQKATAALASVGPKAAAPKSNQPEQYHAIDPEKVGFKIVLKVNSMSQDALGRVSDVSLNKVLLDDEPSPVVEGHEYLLELLSDQVKDDGMIHTKQFGDLKISSGDFPAIHMMMTDSQIKNIQAFLKSKKN